MKTRDAIRAFAELDQEGRRVFTTSDLREIFSGEKEKTFSEGLRRLVGTGQLERIQRGIYVNRGSVRSWYGYPEELAAVIRRGHRNYVSLECALSAWGIISQVPYAYLSVMTTGRKGITRTRNGWIEFTHTARQGLDLEADTVDTGLALRLATPQAALRDLRRVGRNLHMVDMEEYAEEAARCGGAGVQP